MHCCDAAIPLPEAISDSYIPFIEAAGNAASGYFRRTRKMTRFTEKEKVELNRAMTPVATIRTQDFTPATSKGSLLQRWLQRAAVVRELSDLDNRMLDDIGVSRWQIDEIADAVVGGGRPSLFAAVVTTVAAPLVRWYRRNQALRQLSQLDDRMLSDIGINRGDIPNVVQSWDGDVLGEAASSEEDESLLVRGFRRWSRSRATAKALHALDNHTLNDIGLVRGDIDWIAEELATRATLTAANRNGMAHAA
jgi:uncharacterized protein YjiS (DUF1127 family)